jgi:spoIIIJ-associated protein
MLQEAIATGATVELAKEAAMRELKLTDFDDFDIEIIETAKPKILGLFGGSPAKVRVFREVAEPKSKKQPAQKNSKKQIKSIKVDKKVKEEKPAEQPREAKSVPADHPQVKAAVEYLTKVISSMNVKNLNVEAVTAPDGVLIVIDGDDLGIVIGRKGETVDALQHLASLVANRAGDEYIRITLNPSGYREHRKETLCAIAQRQAQRAVEQGKNIALDPMNSYERRIIHSAVGEIEGVQSWSIGEGDNRRVVIGTSKENKIVYIEKKRRDGGRGRRDGRYGRGRKNSSQEIKSEPKREAKKDASVTSLYGKID